MLSFRGKINTKPSNHKLKIFLPLIEGCIQENPSKRPSADRIIEFLNKVKESSHSSDEEESPDIESDSPEIETIDKYYPITSSTFKSIAEQKPKLKKLNIKKQVSEISLCNQ